MLVPDRDALDLSAALAWGRLVTSPLLPGTWALLEPAGTQNHAPHLCWLSPDRLACVWMAGDQEGTAGMSIFLSELRQGEGSWTSPVRVSRDDERSEQNPFLFVTIDGRLHLMHTAQEVRRPDQEPREPGTAFSMQWTARLRHQSCDPDALVWGDCVDALEGPAFCRHPPAPRADGTWLLPIYRSLESGGAFGHDHSAVLVLDAEGQAIGTPCSIPGSTGRVHGSLVATDRPGTWLQFFRSRLADHIYRSRSHDDGLSWSEPEAIPLPNNNSSIQALRLRSGRLAMVFNRFALSDAQRAGQTWGEANWPRRRWPLSLALSEDDGDSWPWIRDIDTGWGFCGSANGHLNGQLAYPSLLEGAPGDLHLAYSWAGRKAIRYLCLREEDILGVLPAA